MVIVHQTAEVKHIRVIALTVQTVQNRHEPASKGRKYYVCVPAHLYKIPSQAGEAFDEDEVDNALPSILQHFQKSGPLEVAPAVPIVSVYVETCRKN